MRKKIGFWGLTGKEGYFVEWKLWGISPNGRFDSHSE